VALKIGELVGFLRIDRSQWTRGIEFAKRQLASVGEHVAAIGRANGLILLAAQGAQAAAAIAPVSGALLAIPAAAAVAGMALATVKVATKGVGDAMSAMASGDAKQIKAALAGLTPEARAFVKAWAGLQQSFRPIQQAVQDAFFRDLHGDINQLARGALPGLRQGLLPTAGALNVLAREGIQAASTPMFSGLLAQVGRMTAASLDQFQGVASPLAGTINNAARAGLPLVLRLSELAGAALRAKLAFWGSEEGSGRMEAALDRGAATAGRLTSILGNVRSALAGAFGAAGVVASGRDLLGILDQLTARMATWVNSANGQTVLQDWFARMADLGSRVAEVLGEVVSVAMMVMGVMTSLPGPVQSTVTQFIAWSIVLGPIASRLVTLGTVLLTMVGHLGTATAAVRKWLFVNQIAGNQTRATWLMTKVSVVGSWLAMQAKALAAGARIAAVATANALRAAGVWVLAHTTMLASTAAAAVGVVAGWVLMGMQSLLQAARMAAAWVIAMGPVGWVIAAVIGLVALIVANWDTIWSATKRIWDWIWTKAIRPVIDLVVGYVNWWVGNILGAIGMLAELPGRIGRYWLGMYWAAFDHGMNLLNFARGIPGRLLDALGSLASLLVNAGKDVVRGLWDGIQSMAGWLADKVTGFVKSAIPGPIRSALNMHSPSRVAADLGRWVPAGLAQGMLGNTGVVVRAAQHLAGAALPGLPTWAGTSGAAARSSATDGRQLVRLLIDSRGADRLGRALLEWLQETVRVDYGGDSDAAFTGGR
jgi:hypothetical protein